MRFLLRFISTVFLFSPAVALRAQEAAEKPVRPVAVSTTVEFGGQSALDTYLTSARYSGWNIALGYERLRATPFAPERWLTRHEAGGAFAMMKNRVGNGQLLSFYLDYSFALLHRWTPLKGLQVAAGGEVALTAGVLYNQRNSNNPGSAKASVDLGATAMASYRFRISRLPVTARYSLSLPVAGAFFSPAFGESYYEIFDIGNSRGVTHFGFWHNRFDMRNYLSVDLHIGKRALRLGYRQTTRVTHINNIDTQVFSHVFVLGISGEIFRAVPVSRRVISVYN